MFHDSYSLERPVWHTANDPLGQVGHVLPMPHDSDQRYYRDNCVTPRRERKHPRDEKKQAPKDSEHKIDDYA